MPAHNYSFQSQRGLHDVSGPELKRFDVPEVDLRQRLAGTNINQNTFLATDYLNHFNEMAMMIDLSKEFNYHAGTFHHGIEAYKIADLLAENGSCAALWPDWWGFKMEAYDMVQENVAIVDAVKNSCAVVHSDSDTTIQRLNQEAAKVMYSANQNGFDISEQHAIKWITANAAKSLGIEDKTGSLEAGKQADVVIWNQSPFSVYAKAEQVFVDGAKVYDRNDSAFQAQSDFMLGQQ